MQAVKGAFDTNEKDALEKAITVLQFRMQARELAFHGRTSGTWARLLSFQARPGRSLAVVIEAAELSYSSSLICWLR
jgi:hypothetical protein